MSKSMHPYIENVNISVISFPARGTISSLQEFGGIFMINVRLTVEGIEDQRHNL
jgi:hypothetical protein